ncbi:MAG: [protein-PII] uridylyltransferase [Thermodesulfobacteriota bacterium]|nr:MAG: [protein-PII] uridylyltransferase [Thermodesulfobacteriota bacterium]
MFHSEFLKTLSATEATTLIERVKGYLKASEAELKKSHRAGARGTDVCRAYTLVIDDLIRKLFDIKAREAGLDEPLALVAVGGYGRNELNIRSDIDLVLLHKKKVTPRLEEFTQGLLYLLWDTGLDLGFSIRTAGECIDLAAGDLKTLTSLLDARFVLGDREIYSLLNSTVRKKLLTGRKLRSFINEKVAESESRHKKYGGSIYILEPNIKEGEGGLRDFHTAMWVAKAMDHGGHDRQSAAHLSGRDMRVLMESVDFLLWVRNDIHFETSRKTDQLTFDHQRRLARLLGFSKTEKGLAVEHFMEAYYRNASNINHYSNLILSRYMHRHGKKPGLWPTKKVPLDDVFFISRGELCIDPAMTSIEDPLTAIKAFEHAQASSVELNQHVKDLILDYLDRAGEELSDSEEVAKAFLRILRGAAPYRPLKEMHRLKFLDKYIPEFASIRCRVQHDLYHIYTVDEHSLFAVREIERLTGVYKGDFPHFAALYAELEDRAVLMLAVLFHDIGKALGKGHSEKGAEVVPHIARRLCLSEEDEETLVFLVRNHLILANTAQYRDIHDEKLVVEFAKKVGDVKRLNMLYLLTFADVRAVGPDVWNQWKGALFQELYLKVLKVLERGDFEIEAAEPRIERIKSETIKKLIPQGFEPQWVEEYFKLLPQRYFLSNSPLTIAGHLKVLKDFKSAVPHVLNVRQDREREYTEVIVCAYDIQGLFSMIAGVMAASGIDILGAQILTLKNGVALDILQVRSPHGSLVTDEFKLKKIDTDLSDVITGRKRIEDVAGKRRPSILDRKAKPGVPTRVNIDNEVSESYTVIEILTQNRIGLLYDITSKLFQLGLYINLAKISTKGGEAADVFYVKDIFGQKIYHRERLVAIAEALKNHLESKAKTLEEKA